MDVDAEGLQIGRLQAAAFVSTLDRFAMAPMTVAMAHTTGLGLTATVHASSAYFLAYGASQPLWGIVSDHLGRVRTMQLTLFLAGIATLASATSTSGFALLLTRALAGGFFGAAYPSSLIYIGDTVDGARRQGAVARLMVGVAAGTAGASLGAGVLSDVATWRLAFVFTGVLAMVIVVLLAGLPEPSDVEDPSTRLLAGRFREVATSGTAMLVVALAFVEGSILLGALTLLPPAMQFSGASASKAGAVTAVYGIAVFATSWLVVLLARRWHPAVLITIGASAAGAACAVFAISQSAAAGVMTAAMIGLAWTCMHSSLQTWATEVLPRARGIVVSLFAGSLFAGSALAGAFGAVAAEHGIYGYLFAGASLLCVPLSVVAAVGRARWHHPETGRA